MGKLTDEAGGRILVTPRRAKLAILTVLASKRTQHRATVIGRSESWPGDVERQLGVTLSSEERETAAHAFEELNRAGWIRCTWTDVCAPESWFEITNAGRAALDCEACDDLDIALARIRPHLLDIRDGAWAALASHRPDSLRQAAHSGRELIDQTLKEGAPEAGSTRRERIKHLMRRHRGRESDLDLDIIEAEIDLSWGIPLTKLTATSCGGAAGVSRTARA